MVLAGLIVGGEEVGERREGGGLWWGVVGLGGRLWVHVCNDVYVVIRSVRTEIEIEMKLSRSGYR
jgi:hypothetical protein